MIRRMGWEKKDHGRSCKLSVLGSDLWNMIHDVALLDDLAAVMLMRNLEEVQPMLDPVIS